MGVMRFKRLPRLVICAVAGLLLLMVMAGARVLAAGEEQYDWDNVTIGGGGYVTGLVAHPNEPDLVYIRTDVGGAYRWNPQSESWTPLLHALTESEWSLYGVDSLAVDPSNADIVYAAVGKYQWSTSDILKSTDRGASWVRTGFPVKNASNSGGKDNGERLAVDPNNSNIIYMGTRWNGLWKSTSAAETGSWSQVTTLPASGSSGLGVSFVLFDKTTGSPGSVTQSVYAGVKGAGIYSSTDGGENWTLLGGPVNLNRAALAADGTLYVTHAAGVTKLAGGVWTNVTPAAENYVGITVDPVNPQIVMTAVRTGNMNGTIYRSVDGGTSWTPVTIQRSGQVPWWPNSWWSAATSSLTIDPHYPNRVWLTDWFGTWKTDDITGTPSLWRSYEKGHEELVTFALRSTPRGATLLSGHADADGMRHTALDAFPTKKFAPPNLGDTTSIDFQESNPDFVVRVGSIRYANSGGGGYSLNNGDTWSAFSDQIGTGGRVAVSADSETIVWVPQGKAPYVSTNRGLSWTVSSGAPSNTVHDFWVWQQPLASDRVNGDVFYLLDRVTGKFYVSHNGGASFSVASTLPVPTDTNFRIATAPHLEGVVWAALNNDGLYRSNDKGSSWTKLENVQRAKLVAFGKNRPGRANPSVFVVGTIDNVGGTFRSDDMGVTWNKITSANPAVGNETNTIEGDRQVWGRVYIGTNGTGVFYGEAINVPEGDTLPPSAPVNLHASATGRLSVDLAWDAAADNVGIIGYDLYQDDVFVGSTTGTSFAVKGLNFSSSYVFTVKARDWDGNVSAPSTGLSVTTLQKLQKPVGLVAAGKTQTSVSLSWQGNAEEDVAGYRVYAGVILAGTSAGPNLTIQGLIPGTSYSLAVKAFDEAGVESDASAAVTAVTNTVSSTTLLTDDFEDGDANGWTTSGTNWAVVKSASSNTKVLKQNSTGTATALAGEAGWQNYDAEAKIKLLNFDVQLSVGLLGRYQDAANYYSFVYKPGLHKLQIIKRVNGTDTVLGEKEFFLSNRYDPFNLRASLQGSKLELYVNGVPLITAYDSALQAGKVGLYSSKVWEEFDNVKVIRYE